MRITRSLHLSLGVIFIAGFLICIGSVPSISVDNSSVYAQNNSASTQQSFLDWYDANRLSVKITSHNQSQTIPLGDNKSGNTLTISGISSDDLNSTCRVEGVINKNLYNRANATGPNGPDDFSQWKLTFPPGYYRDAMIEGPNNKVAAKVSCLDLIDDDNDRKLTEVKSYSVNLTGIRTPLITPPNNSINGAISYPQPSNIESNATNSTAASINKPLLVSMEVDRNPVILGSDQSIEITVNDATTMEMVDEADGEFKLIDGFGNVVYNFTFELHNGDASHNLDMLETKGAEPGNFTAVANVEVPGYQPSSKMLEFEVVDGEGEEEENEEDDFRSESDDGELFE